MVSLGRRSLEIDTIVPVKTALWLLSLLLEFPFLPPAHAPDRIQVSFLRFAQQFLRWTSSNHGRPRSILILNPSSTSFLLLLLFRRQAASTRISLPTLQTLPDSIPPPPCTLNVPPLARQRGLTSPLNACDSSRLYRDHPLRTVRRSMTLLINSPDVFHTRTSIHPTFTATRENTHT